MYLCSNINKIPGFRRTNIQITRSCCGMAVISFVSASPDPNRRMSSVEEKPLIWNGKKSVLKWSGNHLLTFLGILFSDLNDSVMLQQAFV